MKQVKILSQKIIKMDKGDVKKFITKNSKEYKGFGECYFSEIKKNSYKGWKKNISTHQMLTVISGSVIFYLIDERVKNKVKKYKILIDSNKNYQKLIIPKNIWYSFKNNSKQKSIIFNFLNIEHKKTKVIRK